MSESHVLEHPPPVPQHNFEIGARRFADLVAGHQRWFGSLPTSTSV